MISYDELVVLDVKEKQIKSNYYYKNCFSELRIKTGDIARGQTVAISGKPTSGKASFVDMLYVINIFTQWRNMEGDKPPLKIFYFGFKKPLKYKLKKWTSLYFKLKHKQLIDVPTLNNNVNKLYKLRESDLKILEEASGYFTEMFENDILEYIEKPQTPTQIYMKIKKHLNEIGTIQDDQFIPHDSRAMVINIIEDFNKLAVEHENDYALSNTQLKTKMINYLNDLRKKEVLNVIFVPVKQGSSYTTYRPNIGDLGDLQDAVDLGYVLYNPYTDNVINYENYEVNKFRSERGASRFRSVKIVSNQHGPDNISKGMFFLGECGYFSELPHPSKLMELNHIYSEIERLDKTIKSIQNG